MRLRIFSKLFLGVLAIVMIVIAVFAVQLGIDADTEWGPSRKILLVVGLLLLAVALSGQFLRAFRVASNALTRMLRYINRAALGVPFISESLESAARIVSKGYERVREHRAMEYILWDVIEPLRINSL